MTFRKSIFSIFIFIFSVNLFAKGSNDMALSFAFGFHNILNLEKPSDTPVQTYNGAPSPVLFAPSFTVKLLLAENVTLEPGVELCFTNYLFKDNKAYPAEIENRTAFVTSLLLDVPAVYTFRLSEHNSLFAGGGLAFNIRFGIRAANVTISEAGSDISNINKYFYQKARFIYPSVQFGWNYKIEDGYEMGLKGKLYIPITSLITKNGFDEGIIGVYIFLSKSF